MVFDWYGVDLAVGAHDADGQTRYRIGLSAARRAAKTSGNRRGQHMEVSTKYLTASTRTLLALMPLYFGERLVRVAMVVGRNASNQTESAAYTAMHNTTVDTHQAVHCWCRNVVDNMREKQRRWCASVPLVSKRSQRAAPRRWLMD